MVYARNCKPATASASAWFPVPVPVPLPVPASCFSGDRQAPKSMSMGGFDFQRRSMKQSTFNWISQANPTISIWSISLCLAVGKTLIRFTQSNPSSPLLTPFETCNITFRNLRYDEITQAQAGALLRTLSKNVAGRQQSGAAACHGPKKDKNKIKNNDRVSRSCQIAGIIINLGPNNNNNTCMQMNAVRRETFHWTVLVLNT